MADRPEHAENKNIEMPPNENHEGVTHQSINRADTAIKQPRKHRYTESSLACYLHMHPDCSSGDRLCATMARFCKRSSPTYYSFSASSARRCSCRQGVNRLVQTTQNTRTLNFVLLQSDPTPIRVGSIEGRLGLLEIIQNGGRLGTITVKDTEIHLAYDDDHVSNLQKTFGTKLQKTQPPKQSNPLKTSFPGSTWPSR